MWTQDVRICTSLKDCWEHPLTHLLSNSVMTAFVNNDLLNLGHSADTAQVSLVTGLQQFSL